MLIYLVCTDLDLRRNNEVKRSIDELINEVKHAPRDNSEVVLDQEDCQRFRFHFSRLLFQVLDASALATE